MLQQNSSIALIKGIGPKTKSSLERLNILTANDLLYYFPRKYIDYSKVQKIQNAKLGDICLLVKFEDIKQFRTRNHRLITQATANDDTGKIKIIWFNQPYRKNTIIQNQSYYLAGTLEFRYNSISIINPNIEQEQEDSLNMARIVPIYPLTKGISSKDLRNYINQLLNQSINLNEYFPESILKKYQLLNLKEALINIHFPKSENLLERSKKRFNFEELFLFNLSSYLNQNEFAYMNKFKLNFNLETLNNILNILDFKLTDNQKIVLWQIIKDLSKNKPMHRLIEGDVGTGKTIIAQIVAYLLINQGYQVALMAPTDILASQHYLNTQKLFARLKIKNKVAYLSSKIKTKEKNELYGQIKNNQKSFIIGTHALINDQLEFNNLGLVIIDEQHRFGVAQREELKKKAKNMPHLLSLSATPIPRSLKLTLFNELDVSKLIQKPYNITPPSVYIESHVNYPRRIKEIKKHLEDKEQLIIISRSIDSNIDKSYSIDQIYNETKKLFPDFKIEILHGKMKKDQKDKILNNFYKNKFEILISTTIIEVGIDNPNATQIVIYNSDKFGLAQLYQLKGRVGRHKKKGTCYLLYEDENGSQNRLKAIQSAKNGFELAELDLKWRGPGSIYGIFQHGKDLNLKIQNMNDFNLIRLTKDAVKDFVEIKNYMLKYKPLLKKVNKLRKIISLD